jgi:4-amino-4-deoxy-L-arabinose transferase-like glycosyltransferase
VSRATPVSGARRRPRRSLGQARAASAVKAARSFLLSPEGLAAVVVVVFIAITAWWLALDQASPDGDASRHFGTAFSDRDTFLKGAQLWWFRYEPDAGAIYPPLVYLIAQIGMLGGLNVDGPVLAVNVVTVPALAAGTFGMARLAYGRLAGLLAVLFVLATPVVIGQFHLFMLDLPLAAFVALSAWLLMASNRFADRRLSLLAGVAVGLGLLTKQTFPVFIAPLVGIILLRGGWRQWRNILLFALPALVIAGPWYVEHLDGLRRVAAEGTLQSSGVNTNAFGTEYTRFSLDNFTWYAWTFANIHFYLPLTLLFLTGLVQAVRDWVRRRRESLAPELIVGAVVGYVGVALVFGYQDARYSIPAVAFVAVVGGGWIAGMRPRLRTAGAIVLAAVLVLNTVAVNTGAFGRVDLHLTGTPQKSVAGEGKLVLLADNGYTARSPDRDARLLDVLKAAQRRGIAAFSWDPRPTTTLRINVAGLAVLARAVPMKILPNGHPLINGPHGISISRQAIPPGGPKPCTRFSDGTGLYVFRGSPRDWNPRRQHNLYCPL